MNVYLVSLRNLIVMTLLLGVLYPLTITLIGKTLFPIRSQGSLVRNGDVVVGSELIAQKFSSARYFESRPSAVDYTSQSSGASQKSATSADLKKAYEERSQKWGKGAPADLLFSSGSGLDPHISPEAAKFQGARIAEARGMSPEKVNELINSAIEERFMGFMGQPRVNVLKLNRSLDQQTPR